MPWKMFCTSASRTVYISVSYTHLDVYKRQLLDRPVSDKLIAIGEVGLGGEVRSVPNLEQRLHEAERIGFERAVIPKHSLAHLNAADYPGMKLVGAAYIADAINALKNDRL